MKKRYIILPAVALAVLALTIIIAVFFINGRFLKKLEYDHLASVSYNGTQIVGEDGLFYLVRDGERVSEGYTSLKSVNDYYDDIDSKVDRAAVLYDYYLARRADTSSICLVTSEGKEFLIEGDTYTLDESLTSLPFLVFTNNHSGLRSAVSLNRLDSDISYQSGNVLTLRTFKNIAVDGFYYNGAHRAYIATSDNAEQTKYSFFADDGIKITSGSSIELIELSGKDGAKNTFFYNKDDMLIVSYEKAIVAKSIQELRRTDKNDWVYAVCKGDDTVPSCIITIAPDKQMTFTQADYAMDSAFDFGDCMVMTSANDARQHIVNILSGRSVDYKSVVQNDILLRAEADSGEYIYINSTGSAVTKSTHADMVPHASLSDDSCYVLSSATAGAQFYYFARIGSDTYTLDTTGITVEKLASEHISAYKLTKETVQNPDSTEPTYAYQYALLAPFSATKCSEYYDTLELMSLGRTEWIWAQNLTAGTYDILDPLSAKPHLSFKTATNNADRYSLNVLNTLSLTNDTSDAEGSTSIEIISVTTSFSDMQKDAIRYFALYRAGGSSTASLLSYELGYALDIDEPCTNVGNYLAAHTASGTAMYALDAAEALELTGNIPYRAERILTDITDKDSNYVLVSTENGMKGVYTPTGECILAPYYGDIRYVEDNCFIVNMRGAYGVIRVNAGKVKQLMGFKYVSIQPLGNNGYYAIEGNRTATVAFGKNTILRTSVQSFGYIKNYTVDSGGILRCNKTPLLSADGRLYTSK